VPKIYIELGGKEERDKKSGYEYQIKHHAALATQLERQVEKKVARGGEAQRADAAARHQDRSTSGGQKIGVKYRGFVGTFSFHTGGFI